MSEPEPDQSAAADCAERLWSAAVDGDDYTSVEIVLRAVAAGVDAETVLLDVIGAVQRRVGCEWAANRLTVAQEHAVTAISERGIAALTHALGRPEPWRGRVSVACVDGEWHALPARLLAEVLTLRGFRVDYLGAQVPTPHLINHLHRTVRTRGCSARRPGRPTPAPPPTTWRACTRCPRRMPCTSPSTTCRTSPTRSTR